MKGQCIYKDLMNNNYKRLLEKRSMIWVSHLKGAISQLLEKCHGLLRHCFASVAWNSLQELILWCGDFLDFLLYFSFFFIWKDWFCGLGIGWYIRVREILPFLWNAFDNGLYLKQGQDLTNVPLGADGVVVAAAILAVQGCVAGN